MRIVIGMGALVAVLAAGAPAAAQNAPWCMVHVDRSGIVACSYATFAQCLESSRGVGGFCQPNYDTRYADPNVPRGPRRDR